MTPLRLLSLSFSLAASSSLLLASGVAHATCTTTADCPKGFACETVGLTACPAIACAPGQTCPVCTPSATLDCVPGPCATDADCATDMVCYKQTVSECSVSACPAGATCTTTPTCTSTTTSSCVPRYTLPCKTDTDCGAGFTCAVEQLCACMGSSGTGSASAGSTTPSNTIDGGTAIGPLPPMPYPYDGSVPIDPYPYPYPADAGCGCTAGTTSYCQAKPVACATSADCATGWTCTMVGGYSTCYGVASTTDGGIVPMPTCTTSPGTLQCVPPYSQYITAPMQSGAYKAANGETVVAPGAATQTSGDTVGTGRSQDSGGCQMTSSRRAPSSAALLGLLGLVGLARRRRARA